MRGRLFVEVMMAGADDVLFDLSRIQRTTRLLAPWFRIIIVLIRETNRNVDFIDIRGIETTQPLRTSRNPSH